MPFYSIPADFLQSIRSQAERDYPHETCGMLLGPASESSKVTRLRPCRNVQDLYHAQDPAVFSRTGRTAYFIDPGELLTIQKENRQNHEEIRVIYHSHCEAGAYFSEEDQRVAISEGKPCYPGVQYLVVSVLEGKSAGTALFRWNETLGSFDSCNLS